MSELPKATPWEEGYMEGRAASGTIESIPYRPGTEESMEWLRGWEAGREDARQDQMPRPCCGRPNADCDCEPATQGKVW